MHTHACTHMPILISCMSHTQALRMRSHRIGRSFILLHVNKLKYNLMQSLVSGILGTGCVNFLSKVQLFVNC